MTDEQMLEIQARYTLMPDNVPACWIVSDAATQARSDVSALIEALEAETKRADEAELALSDAAAKFDHLERDIGQLVHTAEMPLITERDRLNIELEAEAAQRDGWMDSIADLQESLRVSAEKREAAEAKAAKYERAIRSSNIGSCDTCKHDNGGNGTRGVCPGCWDGIYASNWEIDEVKL